MIRIDDKLTAAETKEYIDRANASMDKAMAAKADPTKWLKSAFSDADMTYAVWPDSRAKFQVGVAVVNGKAVLAQSRDTGRTIDARSTYVRCTSQAEAQAMCEVHGDDKRAAA
ncbi:MULTISPECIES: hypothetical protein [Methylobacteriaceae]|uniref:hypothetical protein n=1 Tax=Methylobacteriaceae TaxID=119045 RepID=UPI000CDB5D45|nr:MULTISPECIES: hypothetical protein [Methylobacteriaceae]MCP1549462.1 hypothetical protein [Methylorubrum zatmanii]MCP1553925.1 hypothetical protein [Methylorubrum extorquens]MCP1579764.1 hypothetical protein [Methylorubrum extorquens]POR40983.1 hypothetical protein CRT23_21055 [Methylobacterium sp. V23]